MRKIFLALLMATTLLLGCMGNAEEEKCAKDLKSSDPAIRRKAAVKLGEVATSEAVRLLLLHQDDPDFRVKEAVKKSLDKIGARTFLN